MLQTTANGAKAALVAAEGSENLAKNIRLFAKMIKIPPTYF
jgi:hypothetical protein